MSFLLWWLGGLSPADALLQAGSAQTTTGFATLDLSELDPAAKGVLILSMATGGGVGSTAGGIKLLRLLILIRLIQLDEASATALEDLAIPDVARAICIYRNGEELKFADPQMRLHVGDEVVLLTRARSLKALRQRFE